MTAIQLSVGEPFTSPAWGSNLVVFSSETGEAVPGDSVKEYLAKACRYAKHYNVYLVPERFLLMGYHSMCMISPEGRVIGAQKALFQNLAWRQGKRSCQLDLLHTEFGPICLAVDVDIYHPEIPRLAVSMGAKTIIASQYIQTGDYHTGMVLSGVWSASQSSGLYVIGVCNQFNCVCAPRPLTEHDDGFLVSPRLKMPMTAKLKPERLVPFSEREVLARRFYSAHRLEMSQR